MKPCAGCGRDAELIDFPSALSARFYPMCPTCIDNNAETIVAICRSVNEIGWAAVHPTMRKAIRVYDIEEYVTVPVWAERMSHRQVVPCEPRDTAADAEDDATLRQILDKLPEIKTPTERPSGRRSWRFRALTLLASIFLWRIPA